MPHSLAVRTALESEWPAALALIFQNSQGHDRDLRIRNALRLLEHGELDPQGLFVLVDRDKLRGSMVCTSVAGASGLVWPPLVSEGPGRSAGEDLLARHACVWLQERGAKLAQALLAPEERHLAVPLERNGFAHVTSLWYMRYTQERDAGSPGRARLRYLPYEAHTAGLFHETLLRTYEGALDCPEVNDVRTIDEIIAGHQAQGAFDPERWQLAMAGEEPIGVLMLTLLPESGYWDLSYVGVVPPARGQGFGKELVLKALTDYRAAQVVPQLTLSVDARNQPAWKLYAALGFERYDEREVFLAIWQVSTAYPRAANS